MNSKKKINAPVSNQDVSRAIEACAEKFSKFKIDSPKERQNRTNAMNFISSADKILGAQLKNEFMHSDFLNYWGQANRGNSIRFFLHANPEIAAIDNEVAKLRKQIAEKEAELTKQFSVLQKAKESLGKKSKIDKTQWDDLNHKFVELQKSHTDLEKKKDLDYLLNRVCDKAGIKLLHDKVFVEQFEAKKKCDAFVLAIDIRRSTDLMLHGKTPQLYADFLNDVCGKLVSCIKDNFGVVDKFTGDGLLAYFPDFYSGKDAGYRALATAEACHAIFSSSYRASRGHFTAILKDVGLGIGIDFGEVNLLRVTKELTVVGAPVVYACRLSGAPAGNTYLNHSATDELTKQCPGIFETTDVTFDVKHEGAILCQKANLAHARFEPAPPLWLATQDSAAEPALTETKKS